MKKAYGNYGTSPSNIKTGVLKGEDRETGWKACFKEIMETNSPNLGRYLEIQVYNAKFQNKTVFSKIL